MVLNRNTSILFVAQCMFVSSTVLMVTVGGIVGTELAPAPVLVTLPLSLMVVGTALTTIPASLTMQRFGRRAGFVFAACVGLCACLLSVTAVSSANFVIFCAAAVLVGMTVAFSQQFRFAAAESVPLEKVSQAISFILLGSIGGAFLGPELVSRSPEWTPDQPFKGAFLAAAGCYLMALVVLIGFRPGAGFSAVAQDDQGPRPLLAIIALPVVLAAVLGAMVGQGVMTFVMTATPVSMHVVDGHTLADTAAVIRAHVIAMYLPSLFSALLIGWLGVRLVMFLGVLALMTAVMVGLRGHEFLHYAGSLVLIGIGWNFLFVGGTTMLVSAYRTSERFRVQALNDFSVFGVAALSSLLGGAILLQFGWQTVLLASLAPLLLIVIALIRIPRSQN
jgi:MFS family permease